MSLWRSLDRSFPTQAEFSDAEIDSALRIGLKESIATYAQSALTTGVFVVGLALQFKASNVTIGVLAAIPFLSQLVQLPSIFLIEKLRNRRAISLISMIVSRTFLFVIAATPFIGDGNLALAVLIVSTLLYGATGSVCSCAWSSWMRELVPESRMGWYYSRRLFYGIGISVGLGLLASGFIEGWERYFPTSPYVYSVIFAVGGVMGLIDTWLIARLPEPTLAQRSEREPLLRRLWQPIGDENFRRLLIYLTSWNFAVNLAAPFFTVYMLTLLAYPMSLVIGLTVLSQIANVAVVRVWGGLTDRFSNKAVLSVSGSLFILCILGWTFTTFPDKHSLTLPLLITLHILMGISTAGVTLASGNIALKLSPRGQSTSYLAANSVGNSLAAGIAPVLGGKFADWFHDQELSWTLVWKGSDAEFAVQTLSFESWDFFFFIAFVLGLYSIHRLSLVREVGEVRDREVVRELLSLTRRSFRSLSSAAGLRIGTNFPFSLLQDSIRPGSVPQPDRTDPPK